STRRHRETSNDKSAFNSPLLQFPLTNLPETDSHWNQVHALFRSTSVTLKMQLRNILFFSTQHPTNLRL
ncbi:hypothetical protein Hypma_016623, partial [Hypsizygus marmoreus]